MDTKERLIELDQQIRNIIKKNYTEATVLLKRNKDTVLPVIYLISYPIYVEDRIARIEIYRGKYSNEIRSTSYTGKEITELTKKEIHDTLTNFLKKERMHGII